MNPGAAVRVRFLGGTPLGGEGGGGGVRGEDGGGSDEPWGCCAGENRKVGREEGEAIGVGEHPPHTSPQPHTPPPRH